MSVSVNSVQHNTKRTPQHKAMTIPYPDYSSLSYGLITPPSEMRSTADIRGADKQHQAPLADPSILAPPTNSRYYLRKQHHPPNTLYPVVNSIYQSNNYNSYIQVRRRSGSSSTTGTSTTSNTIARPASPFSDIDSRDFNVGEFAATMVCFLWFEPITIIKYAAAHGDGASQLHTPSDDSIPGQDFVDFCIRVIRTTAVSKEVALLGLLFIHRLRLKNPGVDGKSGSQWRIFTIALMLGNKILDDNTYTNKTWADVTKILPVQDIKTMEVEFLSQMRYNLFVSPQQWEEWKANVSRMFNYHRECVRQRAASKKPYASIPSSPPPISAATSPSFSDPLYLPMSTSPFRPHFAQPVSERVSSPHRALPPMDESPSSASAAVHARVSRKRSREENALPTGLQPPAKRYHAPVPLGIQIPLQQSQRLPYPVDPAQHSLSQQYPQQQSRAQLAVALPDQIHSPSYLAQQYPLQPTSPSYPTSPYAASPLSPFSTASNYNSLSPYTLPLHRQVQNTPHENPPPTGYASPYKYLQNRYSPYAPVRPARTLPSQFNPPRLQWSLIPPTSSEELWYQPLGLHGHSGLRRGIPTYPEYNNPGYQTLYPSHQSQQR